jgi:MoaA/NifB/PqqE/SkfB family radical SAM enzyme
MIVQLEITTRCNFDCFYCAGRHMRQADMTYEEFSALLENHVRRYGAPSTVSLQGEGEPTLHPDFFRMARDARSLGSAVYTITNGTYRHPADFVESFTKVGVSIDTLDEAAADRIGRRNLPRVLKFVEALAPHVAIVIHSVAHREHTDGIAAWCRKNGYTHVIQPLQTKPDFAIHYAKHWQASAPEGRFHCSYTARPKMRYYSLDGLELPCCFIKDTRQYPGLDKMLEHQSSGTWPAVCVGCRYAKNTSSSASS